MRIIFFISEMGPGGAERVVSILANTMTEMGHQVSVVELGGGEEPFYELSPAVDLIPLRLTRKRDPSYHPLRNRLLIMQRIRSVVQERGPDVVYSFINVTNVTVVLALLGVDVPVIVSERNDPFKDKIPPHWRWLMRLTYPLADAIVVQNDHIRSYFERWRPLPKVVVIPNPVPACSEGVDGRELEGEIRLISVGRLIPRKRNDTLLRMMAALPEEYHLHILGDGPLRSTLEELTGTLGVGERVHWHGNVKDVHSYLKSSHLFVTATEYEGQPNAVLEAMSCGVPVVGTAIPPIKAIMPSGYPYLAEPGDVGAMVEAVRRLAEDDILRLQIGELLQKMVQESYEPHIIAERWLALVSGRIS